MLTHPRRRTILVAALAGGCLAALGVTVTSSHSARAASGTPLDLPTSNYNTRAGTATRLKAGAIYEAGDFPIPLRFTAPDGGWGGTQWTTTSHGKPVFGWAAIAKGSGAQVPRGMVEIETAFGATPSTPAILARLRSAGGGATFGSTKRITLAGFPGWQIDGNVFGRFGHVFVPFSTRTGGASPPDSSRLEPGEAFRLVVLDVRGKRVVLMFASAALPAEQFPTFLAEAATLLKSLRFPAA